MTARHKRKEATNSSGGGDSNPLSAGIYPHTSKKRSERPREGNEEQYEEHQVEAGHHHQSSTASSSSTSFSSSSVSSTRSHSPHKAMPARRRARPSMTNFPTSSSASSASSSSNASASSATGSEKEDDDDEEDEDEDDSEEGEEVDYRPRLDLLQDGDPGTLTGPPVRLYADGIFDLFHLGHAKALEQAKKLYPHTYLMVGCCSDAVTHKYKGITVMSEDERYESLRHCKWVDEVVEDAPWVVTDDFLQQHNIDYVCHDALPYADTSGQACDGDVYSHLKRKGKFLETQRTDGISTSDIINRIIVHYDDYVLRQLQRGYSAKEMNVPQWKETTLLTKKYLHDVATTTTKTLGDFQHSFIDLFNRNSDLRCTLRKRRKETWHRVSTLFRTPFVAAGGVGAATGAV